MTPISIRFWLTRSLRLRRLEPDNIYGLPDWAKNNRYDIQTKVSAEDIEAYRKLNRAEHRRMMQAVFEDRSMSKYTSGSKEVPMYQLIIAKGGTKLHEAKPGDTYADGIKAPNGSPIGGAGAFMTRGSAPASRSPSPRCSTG